MKTADDYADFAAECDAVRRSMRQKILASTDDELRRLYYRAIVLSEHEAGRRQRKITDKYGLALMMIREGCAEPAKLAAETLAASDHD